MAAVVAEKLARQLARRARPRAGRRRRPRRSSSSTSTALLPAGVDAAGRCGRSCDEGVADGWAAVVCRMIEALYASRADARATVVRRSVRAGARRRCGPASTGRWSTPGDATSADDRGPHPRLPRRAHARRSRPAAGGRRADRRRLVARDVAVRRHVARRRPPTRSQGFCLRRDPGNALLRELSDLARAVPGAAVPRAHRRADADAVLLRGRPVRSSARPFLVMEKVPGTCPNPWGRDGRRFYEEAAGRGVLPASFTDALVALHTLDWQAAGPVVPRRPGRRHRTSPAARSPSGAALIERDAARARPDPHRPDLLAGGQRPEHRAPRPRPRRLPHRQPAHRRRPRLGRARLGDRGHRRPDVRRRLRAVRPEPGGHRPALQPRRRATTSTAATRRRTGIEIDDDVCRYYQLLYAMRSAAFWMSASACTPPGATTTSGWPARSGRSPSCSSGPPGTRLLSMRTVRAAPAPN